MNIYVCSAYRHRAKGRRVPNLENKRLLVQFLEASIFTINLPLFVDEWPELHTHSDVGVWHPGISSVHTAQRHQLLEITWLIFCKNDVVIMSVLSSPWRHPYNKNQKIEPTMSYIINLFPTFFRTCDMQLELYWTLSPVQIRNEDNLSGNQNSLQL
jgi:hypothetical protein